MREELTALVITWNEAPNIGRTLDRLRWVPKVLVVDSGSDDGTLEILAGFPNVEVVHRPFDTFAEQCNFGLERVRTEWVLSIDADYVLSDDLAQEIQDLAPPPHVAGYRVHFIFCVHGRPLRGSLYPPRTVLYRRKLGRYRNEGHGHRLVIDGEVRDLRGKCLHDDRKPLSRWLRSQQRYARDEARFLLTSSGHELGWIDRLRRLGWPLVIAVPFYVLVWRRCILDGLPGWHYALQRLLAEGIIALEIAERKLTESGRNHFEPKSHEHNN
ncbi:MAG: hypothetical protein KatS3mg117_3245 [Geminicoccaceae bacterium]|nr:MAG: hypothetical protein KatS3mg117_3245 [Geminicoccaceae bacterium]